MIAGLLDAIAALAIGALNAIIAGVGAALAALIALLPNMPDLPNPPQWLTSAEAWVAWYWPVSTTLDVLTFVSSMYFLWWVVTIALRWAKALNE